jgi:hypothetical protein
VVQHVDDSHALEEAVEGEVFVRQLHTALKRAQFQLGREAKTRDRTSTRDKRYGN